MAGRDPPREAEPDNWFDEPDVSDAWDVRTERLARARTPEREDPDDWLSPGDARPRRERTAAVERRRIVALIVVLGVALLFGLLAAAGVFSSSHKATLPPTTSTPPPATTTPPPTTTPAQLTVPTGTLKPGDTGPAVRQLQLVLQQLGYSPGTVDGQYGPATAHAVTQFQQAHSLTADGVVGSQTRAALASALNSG